MADENRTRRDRFGVTITVLGILTVLAAIFFFVLPLDRWVDTLVALILVFAPAIVGGLIYTRIERHGGWDPNRRLK